MNTLDQESIIGVTALLVHAAKIDEKYSENEKKLIREFIKSYLKDDNIEEIIKKVSDSAKPKLEIVIGKSSNADAKIAGITPAVLIFNGK